MKKDKYAKQIRRLERKRLKQRARDKLYGQFGVEHRYTFGYHGISKYIRRHAPEIAHLDGYNLLRAFIGEQPSASKKIPARPTGDFLSSYEWRKVRMQALKKHGSRCQCCGATPADGAAQDASRVGFVAG